jgi:uncharacterized protein YecE (DUF72 family)
MATVFVGESRLPREFRRYAKQFSFLELDCEPGNIPGKARLQSCRALAPEGFVFSLVVPSALANLESADTDKAWKSALGAAAVLRSTWWVVRTPATVRPTRRVREQLAALFERLKEGGRRVAWEPRGVWDEVTAAETARNLGVHLVQDVAREVPLAKGVLYTRLLALGKGAKLSLSLADRVVERAISYDEAFVVVEGSGAAEIRKALALESGAGGLAGEDLDPDADEEADGEGVDDETADEGADFDSDDEDSDSDFDSDDEDSDDDEDSEETEAS